MALFGIGKDKNGKSVAHDLPSYKSKSKALKNRVEGHVNLPHVGMGGKYKGMEFVRGARGRATYLGMKRTRLHEEKEPTSFAKSVRRHEEK